MKVVLLLEPGSSGWQLINKGKELGFKVIVLTSNTDDRIIPHEFLAQVDIVEFVDTNNDQQTIQKALEIDAKYKIDAVLPGVEFYVPLAAKVSSKLSTRGIAPIFVENLRFKHFMRRALEKENLRIPRFRFITSKDELLSAVHYVGFPCVVKPVDGSGSINVRKVNNTKELQEAYKIIAEKDFIAWGRKLSRNALVEEYIFGKEYSVEGFVENGKMTLLSITEKLLSFEPFFVEVGHIVTANLNIKTEQTIYSYVNQVVKCLNISLGPFHCEIRLTEQGPILIEIGARLPGDRICDLIFYATEVDLYKIMYNCYLGIPNSIGEVKKKGYAGIKFFIRPRLGKYYSVFGVDFIKKQEGFQEINFILKPGEKIPDSTSSYGRIGYTIFTSDNYQKLKLTLENVDKYIEFLS